ncbi:DNA polymerase III subunit delta' [soil metagenome]
MGSVVETGETEADTFDGIVGNAAVLRRLGQSLEAGVSHAYLFYGPGGVGKRTVARRFGSALVAGGDAKAEERARRGLHPDLVEVEPEGAFTTIGQVRNLVRQAASRPFEGERRVFILEADTLNVQAANALLKTLEEPEGRAVFVLLAASREGVMPTISSRAQSIRFNPVPAAEVAEFLRKRGVTEPDLAASLGRGSVGLSLRYAGEKELRELREAVFEAAFSYDADFELRHQAASVILERAESVGAAKEAAYLERFDEPDRRAKDGAKRAGRGARDGAFLEALDLISLVYRDAAMLSVGAEDLLANVDRVEEIRRRVHSHPDADWAGAALKVGESKAGLTYNVALEAILEVALSQIRQRVLQHSPGS